MAWPRAGSKIGCSPRPEVFKGKINPPSMSSPGGGDPVTGITPGAAYLFDSR